VKTLLCLLALGVIVSEVNKANVLVWRKIQVCNNRVIARWRWRFLRWGRTGVLCWWLWTWRV